MVCISVCVVEMAGSGILIQQCSMLTESDCLTFTHALSCFTSAIMDLTMAPILNNSFHVCERQTAIIHICKELLQQAIDLRHT